MEGQIYIALRRERGEGRGGMDGMNNSERERQREEARTAGREE